MTIGVGQDSFETLQTRSNSLYCGMGRAVFTIVKGCKENKTITLKASVTNQPDAPNASVNEPSNRMQKGDGVQTVTKANDASTIDLTANEME